jgi:M-phase inducer tyrosine phosphatase
MDVDTSFQAISVPEPPSPISAAPTITQFRHSQTWIPSGVTSGPWSASPSSNGFHDLSSPAGPTRSSTLVHVFSPGEKSPAPKKMRRSISPGGHPRRRSDEYDLASPGRDVESPAADRALRRMTSHSLLAKFQASPDQSSPGPAGLNLIPSPQLAPAKRLRKPALGGAGASAMLAPPSHEGISTARHSAYGPQAPAASARLGAPPPPRRAFSAMGPPSGMGLGMFADESASSSFENSMEMSPAQAVVRRQQTRTLRRMDGGEDISIRSRDSPAVGPPPSSFKFAASPVQQQQPQQAFGSTVTESPSARYMVSSGLPGFGDNEAHGKVLPCHRVKEDGLMRIKPTTLNQLLDGSFDSAIAGFRVIDCRFDYEYQGGHIPGAINLNTNQAIEDLLLGVHAPKPSTSADNSKKTILVFHCEFSAKRAPTL